MQRGGERFWRQSDFKGLPASAVATALSRMAGDTRFSALSGIRSAVRLEPGIQSGDFPTEAVQIESLLAGWLREQERPDIADDLDPFEMTLMHYRRTFVEKMFALHGKVIRLQTEDHPLARDARHYCDLYVLVNEPIVRAMLESAEYEQIRHDYDRISRAFYPRSYRPPRQLSFADSPAYSRRAPLPRSPRRSRQPDPRSLRGDRRHHDRAA